MINGVSPRLLVEGCRDRHGVGLGVVVGSLWMPLAWVKADLGRGEVRWGRGEEWGGRGKEVMEGDLTGIK